MEYQKVVTLLDDTTNLPPESRKRYWVEINDEQLGMYSISNQIKFTTLRANLCDYSDAYREVKITITVPNM